MTAPFSFSSLILTLTLLCGALTGGCASTSSSTNTPLPATEPTTDASAAASDETIEQGEFAPDTLYSLLTAEIAGQRNRFDVALNNYLEQAVTTRDAGIIERAMEISEFLGAQQQALAMSLLWVEVVPQNPEALRAAALQLARAGQHQEAMQFMQQVLEITDDTHFDLLALAALQADSDTRHGLLNNLQQLLSTHPDNPQISFAAALLLQEEQRSEEALALLEEHTRKNRTAASIMLQSRLYASLDNTKKAITTLKKGVKEFPDDTRLRLLLARMLVNTEDYQGAIHHFRELSRQNPEEEDVRLAIALIELQQNNPDAAISELEYLLEQDADNSNAAYHLGRAFESAGQPDAAISTWKSIRAGDEFLLSRQNITRLLIEQQRTDELITWMRDERSRSPQRALELYLLEIEALMPQHPGIALKTVNEALSQFESNNNLLYSRAIIAERLGLPNGLEEDLRQILHNDPDNSMALNALGYTLADRNERLDEALQLIEHAHQLNPNDPAILDSLGWVHYRLGNLAQAEALLQQAFTAFPDAEVGAHLGEVLWQQGKHREARRIWKKAAEQAEDTSLIEETRKRLENH